MAENNMVPGQRANALFSMLNQFGQRLDQTEQLLQSQKDAAAKFAQQKELVNYEYGKRAEVEKIQAVSGLNKELLKTQAEIEKENSERLQTAMQKSQEMIQAAANKASTFNRVGGSVLFSILPKEAGQDKNGRKIYGYTYRVSTDGKNYEEIPESVYSTLVNDISEASAEVLKVEDKTVRSSASNLAPSRTGKDGTFYAGKDKDASDYLSNIFSIVPSDNATQLTKLGMMLTYGRDKLNKVIVNSYDDATARQTRQVEHDDKNAGVKDPKPLSDYQQKKLETFLGFKSYVKGLPTYNNGKIPIVLGDGDTVSYTLDLQQQPQKILLDINKLVAAYNGDKPKLGIVNGKLTPKDPEKMTSEEAQLVRIYNDISTFVPNFTNQTLDQVLNLEGSDLNTMFLQPQTTTTKTYTHPQG